MNDNLFYFDPNWFVLTVKNIVSSFIRWCNKLYRCIPGYINKFIKLAHFFIHFRHESDMPFDTNKVFFSSV